MIKEVTNEFSNQLIKKVNATRKISVDEKTIKATVDTLIKYVKYFNSLDEYQTWVLDRNQDDIKVIKEIKDLILPAAIRYDATNLRFKDLRFRDNSAVSDLTKLSYSEFINAQNDFRRYFKSDINTNTVSLSSLRTVKNFSEVLPHISLRVTSGGTTEWRVNYQSEAFVPIPLDKSVIGLFEENYWNDSLNNVIKQYVIDMEF